MLRHNQQRTDNPSTGITTVRGLCTVTHQMHEITLPTAELNAYLFGRKNIQDAMPSVSADDREFLMSGMSPAGWQQTMDSIDEDDDDDDVPVDDEASARMFESGASSDLREDEDFLPFPADVDADSDV